MKHITTVHRLNPNAPAGISGEGALSATDCQESEAMKDPIDDRDRESFIVNLHALATLLENIPEIPIHARQTISFPLELEAFATIDACAHALAEAGVTFTRHRGTDADHLEIPVGTLTYRFSTMTAERWARSPYHAKAGES